MMWSKRKSELLVVEALFNRKESGPGSGRFSIKRCSKGLELLAIVDANAKPAAQATFQDQDLLSKDSLSSKKESWSK